MYVYINAHTCISALYSLNSRHVCVYARVHACVCVCNMRTYMHTRMISFLLITLCIFVNKTYIISYDMRTNMVSERGGRADIQKKKKKKEREKKMNIL